MHKYQVKCQHPPVSLSSGRALEGQVSDTSQALAHEQQVQWPMTDSRSTPWLGVHLEDAHQNYLGMSKPAWSHLQETMTPFED